MAAGLQHKNSSAQGQGCCAGEWQSWVCSWLGHCCSEPSLPACSSAPRHIKCSRASWRPQLCCLLHKHKFSLPSRCPRSCREQWENDLAPWKPFQEDGNGFVDTQAKNRAVNFFFPLPRSSRFIHHLWDCASWTGGKQIPSSISGTICAMEHWRIQQTDLSRDWFFSTVLKKKHPKKTPQEWEKEADN